MIKLDHLTIFVSDLQRSREWYTSVLNLTVAFEVRDRKTMALQDDFDFTLFLGEHPDGKAVPSCILTFQVADVDAMYEELLEQGVTFRESPKELTWGYGAELEDPDGYVVCLWDEITMREKSLRKKSVG